MNQTFYIDVEEEISSVVDRMNKSMSTDNYFVVPKRALFLQGIVNLKLLKREADKVGKKIIIVTQDEIGLSMAERCGIETRLTTDGIEPVAAPQFETEFENEYEHEDMENEKKLNQQQVYAPHIQDDKKVRLSGVGSENFYDAGSEDVIVNRPYSNIKRQEVQNVQANPFSGPKKTTDFIRGNRMSDFAPKKTNALNTPSMQHAKAMDGGFTTKASYDKRLDPVKEKNVEKMFSRTDFPKKENTSSSVAPISGGRMKKFFLGFIVACILILTGIAAYLFVPSAKVIIVPNVLKNKTDLEVSVSNDALNNENIPVRIIDKEEKITLSYEVSGSSTVANGKKAHGSVAIYNEFSNLPQTLVATTRLETGNGKIFRLVKSVVIPGSSTVDGQIKPGVITAEVIADQAGDEFNIQPSDFKIPGFSGSQKFDKFYGKSTEAFSGGSSTGESVVKNVLSQKEIDVAKQKTEDALKQKIAEMINGELSTGEVSLPQAQSISFTKSAPLAKSGDTVDSFEYSAVAKVKALIFSENEVGKILEKALKKEGELSVVKNEISKIEYGAVDADFEGNRLGLKIHSEITSTPDINIEVVKNELLGKTTDQLNLILKKYPAIKNINVEFQPSFIGHIPQYKQRVFVELGSE